MAKHALRQNFAFLPHAFSCEVQARKNFEKLENQHFHKNWCENWRQKSSKLITDSQKIEKGFSPAISQLLLLFLNGIEIGMA